LLSALVLTATRDQRISRQQRRVVMIRIEVVNRAVDERSGNKNGKNWVIREQRAHAHLLDEHGKAMKYPGVCAWCPERRPPEMTSPRPVIRGESPLL
jgi:hypothetical protein